MKKFFLFLVIFFLAAPGFSPVFSSEIEYSGYYMRRKGQARPSMKKTDKPVITGKKNRVYGHTSSSIPACVLYFGVGADINGNRYRLLLDDSGMLKKMDLPGIVVHGDARKGTDFLNGLVSGNYVKICQPRFRPMPEDHVYGLVFVEPLMESAQEMLLDKGFADVPEGKRQ